ncbi:MAG: hypothetical protein RIB58_09175 [Phycisphaerales bacterium]|jgi:hypothetical protein
MGHVVFIVLGIPGERCRADLQKLLIALGGVRDVVVGRVDGRASVWYEPPCEAGTVAWAILCAGYGVWLSSEAGATGQAACDPAAPQSGAG